MLTDDDKTHPIDTTLDLVGEPNDDPPQIAVVVVYVDPYWLTLDVRDYPATRSQ